MKYGIISDTHITLNSNQELVRSLIEQLKHAFSDVDIIIHAGDVSEPFFLEELEKIAPVSCVRGNIDNSGDLKQFIVITANLYKIGVIHILPENLEEFAKEHDLQIIVFGHTHIPLIKGTTFDLLLLNPGSPTKPKAPPQKPGFHKPVARPTVMTLNFDKDDIMSTFIVTLKF
ncbi:MAG: metallophosphoesterase family protein [Promethearchaeota archaeon]|jgi:putative phosphoesterase